MSNEQGQEIEVGNTQAPKAVKAPKAPKEAIVRDVQNGVTRPATGTKTGFVWETADKLSNAMGAPVPRKQVMEVCREAGINDATIATQYSRWRGYNGLTGVIAAKPVVAEVAPALEASVEEAAPVVVPSAKGKPSKAK